MAWFGSTRIPQIGKLDPKCCGCNRIAGELMREDHWHQARAALSSQGQKKAPAGEDQRALLTGKGLGSGQSPATKFLPLP
jgi:hypothetical protein